jgi:hypothetical protein
MITQVHKGCRRERRWSPGEANKNGEKKQPLQGHCWQEMESEKALPLLFKVNEYQRRK